MWCFYSAPQWRFTQNWGWSQKNTYKPSKPEAVAENVLARDFAATRPNEKWATDVTEFKIPETSKKLYLSAIMGVSQILCKHRRAVKNRAKIICWGGGLSATP